MKLDLKNLSIGSRIQDVVIQEIIIEEVTFDDGHKASKAVIKALTPSQSIISLDEAWVKDHKNSISTKGLWISLDEHDELKSTSTLAKVLVFNGCNTPNDLIGMTVTTYPNERNFRVLSTTVLTEDQLPPIV